MKKVVMLTVVLALAMIFSNAYASDEWNTFSDNLVQALRSDNDGLKASAMQMIIKHRGQVWVHDAAYDIYLIFRNHENDKMRQLALVTLYNMDNKWCISTICDELEYETSPSIRHQIMAIMCKQKGGNPIILDNTRLASN